LAKCAEIFGHRNKVGKKKEFDVGQNIWWSSGSKQCNQKCKYAVADWHTEVSISFGKWLGTPGLKLSNKISFFGIYFLPEGREAKCFKITSYDFFELGLEKTTNSK